MAEALRDRQFALYLAISCAVLIVLAMVGAGWFLAGMLGFVAFEASTALRANLTEATWGNVASH